MEQGASIEQPSESGLAPLHLAAVRNDVAVAKQLLAEVKNVDVQTFTGATPLFAAAIYAVLLAAIFCGRQLIPRRWDQPAY